MQKLSFQVKVTIKAKLLLSKGSTVSAQPLHVISTCLKCLSTLEKTMIRKKKKDRIQEITMFLVTIYVEDLNYRKAYSLFNFTVASTMSNGQWTHMFLFLQGGMPAGQQSLLK
ncbi:hypothetical protein ACJX0J_010858 [Zea mays]